MLGRRLGRDFLVRHGPRLRITEAAPGAGRGLLRRHGGKAILIGRFIGFVRAHRAVRRRRLADAAAPLPALRRPRRRACGATAFVRARLPVLALARPASRHRRARRAGAGPAIVVIVGDRRRRAASPAAAERCGRAPGVDRRPGRPPAGRPAGAPRARARSGGSAVPVALRALGPAALPVRDRVTPGQLGLELTTLLAIARGRRRSCSSSIADELRRAARAPG